MANRATNRPTSTKSRAEGRPTKRIPVSGNRDILTVQGKEEGFVYRWVNDIDNRLLRFQNAGYEFVQDDVTVGQRNSETANGVDSVVSKDVGKGVTAYLMRIPEEFYKEDQEAKHSRIRETEEAITRELNSKKDGTYGKVDIS